MLTLMQLAAAMNGSGTEPDPAEEKVDNQCKDEQETSEGTPEKIRRESEIPEEQHLSETPKKDDIGSDVDGGRTDVLAEVSTDSLGTGDLNGSGPSEGTSEPEEDSDNNFDAGVPVQGKEEGKEAEARDSEEPETAEKTRGAGFTDETNEAELFVGIEEAEIVQEIVVPKKVEVPVIPIIRSYSITEGGNLGLVAINGETVLPEPNPEDDPTNTVPTEGTSVDQIDFKETEPEVTPEGEGTFFITSVDEGSSVDIAIPESINSTFDKDEVNNVTFDQEKSDTTFDKPDVADSKLDIESYFLTEGGSDTRNLSDLHEGVSEVISNVIGNKLETSVESDIKPQEKEFSELNGGTESVTSEQSIKMPEKTEQEEPLAPALQNATCRYRWAKNLATTSLNIMFFSSLKMEEPVKLTWTEGSECYYSEEYEIPCGAYKGNLVVDGRTFPVEDITVKHYTFEVDLYVKDDVIDDEGEADRPATSPYKSNDVVDAYRDVGTDHSQYRGADSKGRPDPVIHISNKYEELIRQQLTMTESINNLEMEAKVAAKSDPQGDDDFTSTGRQSPLGDNAAESFQDGGADLYNNEELNALKGSLDASVIEDEVERSSMPPSHHSSFENRSAVSPSRQTPSNVYGGEDLRSPLKSAEPFLNGSGKHTPIDDVINNFFTDQRPGSVHSHTSSARHTPQEEVVVKDVLSRQLTPTRSPVHSYHGSDKQSPTFIGDVLGQSTPVANSEHSGSQQGSARQTPVKSTHSSARQTPQLVEDMIRNTSQDFLNGLPATGSYHGPVPGSYHGSATGSPAPASYHGSATGSPAPASYHGSATGSPAPASYHGSATGSPAPASYHGSATGSPAPASYHGSATGSPAPASYHGSATGSPAPASYHGSATGSPAPASYHGSATGSPAPASYHGSATGSPAPASYHGSGSIHGSAAGSQGSYHGSQGSGSRPQSLTSEQELSQYFSDRSDPRRTPTAQQQQIPSASPSQGISGVRPGSDRGERSGSAASLPAMNTQQRIQAEKRSMTPDNHIRVPGSPGVRMSPLATGSGQRSGASSRSSTRTITPTSAANGYHVNGEQEDIHTRRIQELEDTVRNLRKLLGSREMEVKEVTIQASDLQEMNISLKEELELARNRAAPGSRGNLAEWERKYNQLMDEKEILAAEVVKLRDRLEEVDQIENRDGDSMGLSNYSPNNPYALQRKIEELQSHVQDLQEANESAVTELSNVEKKYKDLASEHEKLVPFKDTNLSDLQAENRRLHDKISTLWEQGYGDGDRRLRVEVQQFKDDNRALKERNYKLHEENMALREEVTQIRKVLEGVSPKQDEPKLRYIDDRLSQSESKLRYAEDRHGQSEITKLRFSEDRLTKSERLPPPKEKLLSREELDMTYRRVMEKDQEDRQRASYEKDDRFRRSVEKSEGLKSSLKKDDRFYRLEKEERYKSSVDKEDKYRSLSDREDYKLLNSTEGKSNGIPHYKSPSHQDDSKHRYDPPMDKLTQYELSRSRPDRYDQDYIERSRTEGYRPRPDGGSTSGEKDTLGSSLTRYDKQTTPDKPGYSSRDKADRSLKDSYCVEGQKYSSGQEYRALASSYSELLKLTQQSSLGDKRDWSRSEADLHAAHTRGRSEADLHVHSRGRSRDAPERRYSGSVPRGRAPSPPPSSRHQHVSRPRSAQLPRPVYGWDDELHRRTNSERSDSTAVLTAAYPRSDVGPPPQYRPKDSYDRRETDRDYAVLRKSTYVDDKADESDTGTDILVNAQPFDKQMAPPSPQRSELHRRHHSSNHRRHRRRHDSLGSDGSDSSADDIDEQITSLRRRSKSADGRELRKRSAPPGTMGRSHPPAPTKGGERPTFSKTCPLTGPAGFRSITPGVIPTQHNKNALSASTSALSAPDNLLYDEAYIELLKSAFGCDHDKMAAPGSLVTLTTGLRPFAPRTPGDIHMEDVVKFSRQGGKLSQGTVKFVGHLPSRNDVYLGVELDKEEGKHDGTFESARYFKCKPNKGVFVAFNKVVMAWAP